jgi:SAM-dependent methyltransferase
MADAPRTWHYGLVARYWAERNIDGPEIAYFQKKIERFGQPALDAGCGTGRLLLPFLREGLVVDGCDISADMLSYCRKAAKQEGLEPHLYQQALHQLNLPRRYLTIIACGALGIGVTRQQDFQALQRFYDHLNPGGVLLLNLYLPYGDAKEWQLWQKELRKHLPEPWPEAIGMTAPADGSDYELHSRIVAFDPLEQRITRQMRTLLWRDGQLVAEEVYTLTENLYYRNECHMMLEGAGFIVEAIEGEHDEVVATPEHDILVFMARKRS